MTMIAKVELDIMLDILNIDTLDTINRKIVVEEPYSWGRTPLLRYAPEALADYADAIYRYVIAPLTPDTATDDDLNQYIAQYLAFYLQAETAFTSASVDLAHRLLTISKTPIKHDLPPNYIDEGDNVYDLITDYFDGKSYGLYPHFNHILYSYLSPLRRADLIAHDQRLIDLVKEADELIAPYNAALDAFIGRELRRLQEAVKDRIRYTKLKPEDIACLKANSHRLPVDERQIVDNAINAGTLTASELKIFKSAVKELKKSVPLPKPAPKPVMPADDYINFFLQELELAYKSLVATRTENHSTTGITHIDDILASVHAIQHAQATGTDPADIKQKQAEQKLFYLDFSGIRPLLNACIQIDLNSLSVDKIFSSETQSHPVVKAILAFTAKHKSYFKSRYLRFMYGSLAKELHHLLYVHTKGFTEALPPLHIEPLTTEAVASTPKAPRLTEVRTPYFDLTVPIAKVLSDISADTVTTSTEHLSAVPAPDLLVPVQDGVIKRLSHYLTGSEQATPYLLNGELVVHDPVLDQYLKILPTLRDNDYADYIFDAYGYKPLLRRIVKLQELLNTSDIYRPTYELRGQKAHLKAIADLAEWDKNLIAQANELSTCEGYEHIQAELRKILSIHYYGTIFISAHKLAAYTYYPAEYTTFISAKPTDPATGEPLVYHVHHKDGNPSNNRRENLEIISEKLNYELRSTSRPVVYQGTKYNTIKSYCEATGAGNYKNLQQAMNNLETTDQGTYNGRIYTHDTNVITATDGVQTPVITYNGTIYANPKEFADAHKLSYKSLHNALSKARKDNKTSFKYKYHQFYLDDKGNIIEVTK